MRPAVIAEPGIGTASPMLQVHLPGLPMVEWAGHPVAIARRKVRALLYRLAAALEPLSRDHLCFLFWPDLPDLVARRHLTVLLSHLRRALPAPSALITGEEQVGLDAVEVWSDTAAVSRPWPRQHTLGHRADPAKVVALYRGPFLTLGRQYLAAAELAEDVHRRLIDLYAAAGDRNMALRQYEQCPVLLDRELGVEPLSETRAAYQAALEGRFARVSPPGPLPQDSPRWPALPALEVPFVGREAELGRLETAFGRA